jgi:ankyrin repeat protein
MNRKHFTTRFISPLLAGALPLAAAAPQHFASTLAAPRASDFLQAAKDDDRDAIRKFIARRVDVNATQGDGFTALHWAAYNDDVELTKVLLAAGAVPESRTRLEGDTPLFLAAGNGDPRLIDVLLAHGAKLSTTNDNGTTPLMEAAAAGAPAAILDLLAHGADINAREKTYGQSALFFAASHNRYDAVRLLTEHGADMTVKTTVQKLERITVNADGEEVPNDSKVAGDRKNTVAANGASPRARRAPNSEASDGANPAALPTSTGTASAPRGDDSNGKETGNAANGTAEVAEGTPSSTRRHRPSDNGDAAPDNGSVLTTLDSARKKPGAVDDKNAAVKKDEPDAYGFTRSERAARVYGSLTMGGLTALHVAARDGQGDAVRALLEAHADINAQTEADKSTPLLLALINGHYDLARFLIDRGANVALTSTDGLGPLYAVIDVQWAPHTWYPQPVTAQEKTTYLELIDDLIEHHADVNAKLSRKLWFRVFANDETWVDVTGATPFWRAAYAGDLDAMKVLTTHGAETNVASKSNDTPLMVAAGLGWAAYWTSNASSSRLDAVKFCLDHGADINTRDAKGYSAIHGAAFRGDNTMIEYLLAHGADLQVTSKTGDTVADSANGLFEHAVVHSDTVALLEKLGSKSKNNCRSNECVVPPKADRPVVVARTNSKPNSAPTPGDQTSTAPPEEK